MLATRLNLLGVRVCGARVKMKPRHRVPMAAASASAVQVRHADQVNSLVLVLQRAHMHASTRCTYKCISLLVSAPTNG